MNFRKTKIVCTLGPATCEEDIIRDMISAGMNVARCNMSHGDYIWHSKVMSNIKKARTALKAPVAIMMDLKGPEIRIKQFGTHKVDLVRGEEFTLTINEVVGNQSRVSVNYNGFLKLIKENTRILLNDGFIELQVKSKTRDSAICKVIQGGELSDNKSLNLPGVVVEMPYLSEVDKLDILFGIKQNIDLLAISFVQNASNVKEIRALLNANGGENIKIISKVENAEGVKNLDEIIEASDGVMVARGDLGVEVDFKKIPYIQQYMINKSKDHAKFVITATQMLESMISSPRPLRSEVADIAQAVDQGTDAIMLSGETAIGKFPIKCIETMAEIAEEVESNKNYEKSFANFVPDLADIEESICFGLVSASFNINAKAIIAVTWSGRTAGNVSRFHPRLPIVACTPNEKCFYQMAVLCGVTPLLVPIAKETEKLLSDARAVAKNNKMVKSGDIVLHTVGIPVGVGSKTNVFKIDTVE